MGANCVTKTYRTDDKTAVVKQFEADCEQSRHESGHSYSGCVGMFHGIKNWVPIPCSDISSAYEFIEDKHEKWDGAMAVPFRYSDKPKKVPAAVVRLKAKKTDLLIQRTELLNQADRDFDLSKDEAFITCSHCKSKLNRGLVKRVYCPVCTQALYTVKQKKAIDKLSQKIEVIDQKISQLEMERQVGDKIGYVVGGWVSS